MSSYQKTTPLLLDQTETLILFQQLPFFNHDFQLSHISTCHTFRRTPVWSFQIPTSNINRYREIITPPSPEQSFLHTPSPPLSPTLPNLQPADPSELLLLESFENLSISPVSRQLLEGRLRDLRTELKAWTTSLSSERDQAISLVNLVATVAILAVEARLLPQIERLEDLLQQTL